MIDKSLITNAIKLSMQGKYEEAEKIYQAELEKEPNDYMLLSAVGLFYISTKNYEKAKDYLNKACKINPSLGTVSAFGFAEYESENYEASVKILKQALEYGETPDIYDKLIMSLFKLHKLQDAIRYSGIILMRKELNAK